MRQVARRHAENEKAPLLRGFSSIGAPRFELGTSSPPHSASRLETSAATWPEVPKVQEKRVQKFRMRRFPPRADLKACGHGTGTDASLESGAGEASATLRCRRHEP